MNVMRDFSLAALVINGLSGWGSVSAQGCSLDSGRVDATGL